MPGFFLNANAKKKRTQKRKTTIKLPAKLNKSDHHIDSEDDESIVSGGEEIEDASNTETDIETVQEKRLRLAKEYISKLEEDERHKQQDKDIDHDAIAHRLQQDMLEDAGRLQKFLANTLVPDSNNIKILRGHQLSVTCMALSTDDNVIFSASKDGTIIKWNVKTYEKLGKISGKNKSDTSKRKCHVGQVLCLALTTDGEYLASGGQDQIIHIWNANTLDWLHTFKGHRNQITGLAFRKRSHQLYSASHDKTIKVWSLNEMAYVETLFGHEDAVLDIDSLYRECAVSCGGRDRSVRLWKIPEESQLLFQSTTVSSFDCIAMLNEEYFLAGGDDRSLSIFFVRKKKPITVRTNAHKRMDTKKQGCSDESWITAVTSLPYTDLVATAGSCDGCIKLWRCEKSFKSIMPTHSIKMPGFVNSLKFSSSGTFLVAGIGQEHRLGRWWKLKEAKNSICIIPLVKQDNIFEVDNT